MNSPSNFHQPLPGETAMFYCWNCKKSFEAKVPQPGILAIFKKKSAIGTVKCPDCKKNCGLDPKIKY